MLWAPKFRKLAKYMHMVSISLPTGYGHPDVDGKELAQELRYMPDLPSKNMTALEVFKLIAKKDLAEMKPNLWTALRIRLIIPVTVGSAERSFSYLKLIKTYLHSTMTHDRLSGLAIISVNHELAQEVKIHEIID